MTHPYSNLLPALDHLAQRSARGMVARSRLASTGLNALLLRVLSAPSGSPAALIADPVIEAAKSWQLARETMGDLAGGLLSEDLVAALDRAEGKAMARGSQPRQHQLEAWRASLEGNSSVLVTAGTGAGKTECFLIPILQDILANPRPGGGVRAILLYPLNALIESQRERLAAWAAGLGGKVRFALLNGDTPETERDAAIKSDKIELRSRAKIRECPPEILVTNITMLEYLLLRTKDKPLLETSQGALRWIVLDEAHSYIGSQAAEMALLLRRVRAGFGVAPEDVRLMATSATIGGKTDAPAKLRAFAAALAGQNESRVAVVKGKEDVPVLPAPGPDVALDTDALASMTPEEAATVLAPHPRIQMVWNGMSRNGLPLSRVAEILSGNPKERAKASHMLDLLGTATHQGRPLLPWRGHIFHRSQGGIWACPDASCKFRQPELIGDEAGWPFGAVWFSARSRCDCGAPVYEVVSCSDCGQAFLQGLFHGGAEPRLEPPEPGEGDDYALDAEPEEGEGSEADRGFAWLSEGDGIWLTDDARIYDNAVPDGVRARRMQLIHDSVDRNCCDSAGFARLMGLHFGPAFLMGNALGGLIEDIVPPEQMSGLPAGGRRALTFTDSRQGVARLAAKLQQDAERSLTRAFLWHRVQEGETADPALVAKLQGEMAKLRAVGFDDMADDKERELAKLTGASSAPVAWRDLVQRFAGHVDLAEFAGDIWRNRRIGKEMADDPVKLAEAFLFRELFRRPRIQNNPETMGLLRLTFPKMAEQARLAGAPSPLAQAGIDAEGWAALVHLAVDMVFRQALAVQIALDMVPLVAPRFGRLNTIHAARTPPDQMPERARRWPGPRTERHKLVQLIYALTGGSPDSDLDQDRAGEVLDALWAMICATAARDMGQGAWRLDFSRAAVERLDRAWLCPVTRRPYGWSAGGRSPNDPQQAMAEITMPRLPVANAGGLTSDQRAEVAHWAETAPEVTALRDRGLWTDLHDRLAAFPPYIRAQEHSAQIPRATLQRYEEKFREGRINLLNCSTTMEMGVDIADVRLVVNSNVPPALSNYRQRAGRAGRRGEPWAFTLTFCRDLPLDRRVFDKPSDFLDRLIVAPKVWFDSPSLVQRHVNAALLTAWLSENGGQDVRGSIGAFLGAGQTADAAVLPEAMADAFLISLDGAWGASQASRIAPLVLGTCLEMRPAHSLVVQCHEAFERLVLRWRTEHRILLEGAETAPDKDARMAMELRARRLAGEFLLGELARRGFTPAYGFPTDVVTFANLSQSPADADGGTSHLRRGTASRPLDQAIREYAPGAELVIDGLVHQSEGILPAWEAGTDASRLEDLRTLWSCGACHSFDLEAGEPVACPRCGHTGLSYRKVLRPAGFLGAKPAHVGYENLAHIESDPLRLSAHGGDWIALGEGVGRMRADPAGLVAPSVAGPLGGGFAICLDCGRAEAEPRPQPGIPNVTSKTMRHHRPLMLGRRLKLTHDGYCPSANTPGRIQHNVHLAQVMRTDVWEWQLPVGAAAGAALALAAALREALAEGLGVEPDEIGLATDRSSGPAQDARLSLFLHDRAAGGAGLVARMAEPSMLETCLGRALILLDCPDGCSKGCPSCILRPDLNRRDIVLDRPAARDLAQALRMRLALDASEQVFGPRTRLAGRNAADLVAERLQSGRLRSLDIWLHGDPETWDFGAWRMRRLLERVLEAGVRSRIHLPTTALTAAGFDLSCKLAIFALSSVADLHRADQPPMASDAPVILGLDCGAGREALAVMEPMEALPGAEWGSGATAPVMAGPAPELKIGAKLSVQKLIELGVGNAHLLNVGTDIDGPASGFGRRFWSWMSGKAPLEIAAMQSVGVQSLAYTDRYLLSPYTLRLLSEVLKSAPGAVEARKEITLAFADRPRDEPRFLHDTFPSDSTRREVMCQLAPGAEVNLLVKAKMPHSRSLMITLKDGRKLTIHLDQGFGGWRVDGAHRHDFGASQAAQAKAISIAVFGVGGDGMAGAPIAISRT
ncbi:DEAD/DEAH box helicase [Paenirhodobacter populi]|uniref:DEAD/DEAH box helicase n=1 Tax=Paenirhodobacter populi TaxID=2306993 RepID=UPI000FE382E3|nr:DEAD/DEAH box helicase [Sinirhodobacter populi]RWR05441.1 DEAD/DEAH box helicase [Sinirhodobacter populi]